VGFRANIRHPGLFKTHADSQGAGGQGGQGAVKVAAPITQPVAFFIHPINRQQQDAGDDPVPGGRGGNAVAVRGQGGIRGPGAKGQGGGVFHHHRQGRGGAPAGQGHQGGAQVRFVMDRPAKAHYLLGQLGKARQQVGADGLGKGGHLFRGQGQTGGHQLPAQGAAAGKGVGAGGGRGGRGGAHVLCCECCSPGVQLITHDVLPLFLLPLFRPPGSLACRARQTSVDRPVGLFLPGFRLYG